ncbi:LacI family DNA-binding transcriptional regulator [Terrabacter sp. MAHUQ-38]|uniref:LacI family DNA-binding transcriptional regulator n=1 Tax=unclassified Terrabacter TaxID=2630222 RepID=UPI00165E375F|nr:LacI family DNA-binding transcriptional regulator [Terrabacter sp. MAHUQ-38]MBC9822807.1 LacI family DNA-binding transcriptional regulator [Terrabacter sp. MAHUQ-38]
MSGTLGANAGPAQTPTGAATKAPARSPEPGVEAKPATIYDVARVAGVSHQTVSRFLKGYAGIRPETRERVAQALDAVDYRPNLTARSLTTGRSHRIGALTHEIDQVGPSKIAQGASAAAREAGYLLDIITLDMSNRSAIANAVSLVQQHDLAGVLALASTDEMTRAFEKTRFRVPAFIAVEADDVVGEHRSELSSVGFPALVDHLAGLGHRSFLHIAGPTTWSAARNRVRAYEEAIEVRGLNSVGIVHGDWSARSGYDAVKSLSGEVRATAVVAANDQMALGAMLALSQLGLQVPRDVSVTGVDDIPEAEFFAPPLTTLRVDFLAQGRAAVAELLARVNGETAPSFPVLASELVVRASTGPAPV